MHKFVIDIDYQYHHGKSILELSDRELQNLLDFLRKPEYKPRLSNLAEIYPKIFYDLGDALPDVCAKIDEASRKASWNAEWSFLTTEAFMGGDICGDLEEKMDLCEVKYGYKFEYSEKDFMDEFGDLDEDEVYEYKKEHFFKWFSTHLQSLDEESQRKFVADYFRLDVCEFCNSPYELDIPEEICKLALDPNVRSTMCLRESSVKS